MEDLQGIVITDSDGAIVAEETVPELSGKIDSVETSRMVFATVQASKLDFVGSCTSIVAYFENCILVHIRSNLSNKKNNNDNIINNNDECSVALVMTLICLKRVNMAIIFDMEPKLSRILGVLETKLVDAKRQASQTEFH